MIARLLPATSITAVRTINTGAFIATSLLRAPGTHRPLNYRCSNEPTVNGPFYTEVQVRLILRTMECDGGPILGFGC
jgi:hypothetical protein